MRGIALVTLITFGCATARPPQHGPSPFTGARRFALAEPQLELWMEGTKRVDQRESAEALARSREALALAVENRGLDAPDPDALVVIRERAIARTGERKTAQAWSVAGLVVGFVAVVVAAVVLAKSGKKSGKSASTSRSSAHAAVPAPARRGAFPPYAVSPRFAPPPPAVNVFIGFDVVVPVGPYAAPPTPGEPTSDSWLSGRGWFDGDEIELSVELTDPVSGAVTWRRVVRESADPRDAGAVARLVDRALLGLGEPDPSAWSELPPVPPPYAEPLPAPAP
jgi:hypothetical protein